MVSELIDKENASWKTEVVDALFLPHEVEVIKSTPLSVHLLADKQAWACSSNGVFTVRSAYWVAVEMSKGVGNGACFDGRQNRKFWRMIWELATPQNIRHFTWRACRDILPTKANLVRRRVLMEDLCDGCKLALENSNHCFWTCKFACEMWESSKLALPFEPDRDCSFKDLMWVLFMEEDSTPEKAAKVATYAWALWGNRNEVRVGGQRKSGLALFQKAVQYLEEYHAVLDTDTKHMHAKTTTGNVGPSTRSPTPSLHHIIKVLAIQDVHHTSKF
nr:uncharacterized protein LOC111982908 [Quercus suber]